MEEREFDKKNGEFSEERENDIQPGTGQDERKRARHFVTGGAEGSNAYPTRWGMLVNKYLKECYRGSQREHEVHVADRTYTVLRRENVTVFYDRDGNTLFDVENERLAKEAEFYADDREDAENGDPADGNDSTCDIADPDDAWKDEEPSGCSRKAGTVEMPAPAENNVQGQPVETPDPVEENIQTGSAEEQIPKNIGEAACEKLRKGSEQAPDRDFMAPVVGYLLKRCMEDRGLAEDVMQEHKTWEKCSRYIYGQARKLATGNRAMVRDEVVYEWSEDYFHKDDKAEEEKKAGEAHQKEKAAEKKKKASGKKTSEKKPPEKEEEAELSMEQREPAEILKKEEKTGFLTSRAKSGKNRREMDGQMDMFALMGMGV